jgi:thioredoxin reductase (NADPH)
MLQLDGEKIMNDSEKWTLPEDVKHVLKERFKEMKEPVVIALFTKKGENDQFNQITTLFLQELEQLSDKIHAEFHEAGDAASKKYGVTGSPTVMIQPGIYDIRYLGAPFGEEGRSFIEALIMVSQQESFLSKKSKELLSSLKEKRHVRVFVTLSCPYCPGQVLNAFKAAIERPDLIRADCVEAAEYPTLSDQFNVGAVPDTVINDLSISKGLEPEELFINELIQLHSLQQEIAEDMENEEVISTDVIIVGGGPAGLTAGMYAARSGLDVVVVEKNVVGGQVSITPVVENWPGFKNIPGQQLMEMVSDQVRQYVTLFENEPILEIKIGKKIEAISHSHRFIGRSLILATGATHRKLEAKGEDRFAGRGVSYCATCDGNLYKGKNVVVVGGGNTALTDALYLHNIGAKVTILHRRDSFRAEQHLHDSVEREHIDVLWNSTVVRITGKDTVEKIVVKDVKTKKEKTLSVEAVFVAVGEIPNNQLAADVGLKIDETGFVQVDRFGRSNIPRIYAAGDVTGGVRQIVTAVGEGASAATSVFEDISKQSLRNEKSI